MHRQHPRVAAIAVAAALIGTALAGALPPPSRAAAAPAGHPPTAAETLVTNVGTVVTVPIPGVDVHGWSGSPGTGGPPDVPTGADAPAPADQPSTMSIIGPDDTIRVADVGAYPARASGLITRQGAPHCTGALISPDTVLTAGHCVHDTTGGRGWWPVLEFHTRLWTDDHQICAARADGLMAFRRWVEQGDERYDVGLIRLDCPIGETVGWLGVAPATRDLSGADITIQGFPGERLAELWMSVGPILDDDRHLAYYDNDTLNGMSGAALRRDLPHRRRSCSGPCVVGVHAYGLHDAGGLHARHNHGPRLTPAKVAALRAAT